VAIGTDCIGSCKSNYHTTTATTAQKAVYMEMKAQQDQQKMDMSKLNMMINQGEEESTRLRDMYSKELKKRNDR
jgi:hypothetical protein